MNKRQFIRDLQRAGAPQGDIDGLFEVAQTLQAIPLPKLSARGRQRIESKMDLPFELDADGKKSHFHPIIWSLTGSFAVLIAVVVLAQFAMPSSPFYGIRRGIDDVRAAIWPDYNNQILKDRKNEVQQLQKQQAATPTVIEAIQKDYKQAYQKAEANQTAQSSSSSATTTSNIDSWRNQWDWNNWYSQPAPRPVPIPAPTKGVPKVLNSLQQQIKL